MASKVVFIRITVADVDRSINFYRRVLGLREVKTWNDAHTEKAVLFDTGPIKLILAQDKKDWPDPHKPKATASKTWIGLQNPELGNLHQTIHVGAPPGTISAEHETLLGKGKAFYVLDPDGNPIMIQDQAPFGSGETGIRPKVNL